MPDFTPHTLRLLFTTLKAKNYTFQTFAQFLKDPAPRTIVLRHDVDARKMNSLRTAQLEKELGITGTYNFRIVPASYNEDVISQISAFGHEIGYHYEDLAMAVSALKGQGTRDKGQGRKGEVLYEMAIKSFEKNLEILRRIVPVETICMHGSPLSKYDNRKLWERYNYRDFGVIGEPYFDVDFRKVLYLTDTGRRWDGERVSVRDKVGEGRFKKEDSRRDQGQGTPSFAEATAGKRDKEENQVYNIQHETYNLQPTTYNLSNQFHSTFNIIHAAYNNLLPNQIMITIHPQRWDDRPWPWIRECVWQNVKNVGKRILVKKEG